jgi:uncharacterized protein (DUF433 family)
MCVQATACSGRERRCVSGVACGLAGPAWCERRGMRCPSAASQAHLYQHIVGFILSSMKYHDIITIEPGKRGGKPCIRGMRITVYDVLSYLAAGMTEQAILEDFPYLTAEDIRACLSYAADRERQVMVVRA